MYFQFSNPLQEYLISQLISISTFLGILFIPYLEWAPPSRWSLFWSKIISILHTEFKALLQPSHMGSSILFVSLFTIIVFNNFLSLAPYVFTSSSHMVTTLSLSLPLSVTLMLFGWIKHSKNMFAHLVPQGTPFALTPFMVLIKTISNVIRLGTLAVRLPANMIAGHLLLTLLVSTGPSLSLSVLSILIPAQILLLILEFAVVIIQSCVFAVLSTL